MKTTSKNNLVIFLNKFAPKEYLAVILAISVSIPILIYGLAAPSDNVARGFKLVVATERVFDTNGTRTPLFDTAFNIRYENNASTVELELVEQVLNEYLVPYHKLFDRHASYFALPVARPNAPTSEEKLNTPLVHNLKYINDNLGTFVEVEYPLFDLIQKAQSLAIKSNGFFNPFVGELTDFWSPLITSEEYPSEDDPLVNEGQRLELERLQSFVPTSVSEMQNALSFDIDEVNDKYYVRLNSFNGSAIGDLSLTLGGIAKGYMTDVMKEVMDTNHLERGYLYGGASSITTLSPLYFGEPLLISQSSIIKDEMGYSEPTPAYKFSRNDVFSMSTSGTYEGHVFVDTTNNIQYLRSHIIDPFTGYPANHSHQLVSVVSSELSGTELEILSTALIVMSQNEAQQFIRDNYTDIDFDVVYLASENNGHSLYRYNNNISQNNAYFHVSEGYSEKNLEI